MQILRSLIYLLIAIMGLACRPDTRADHGRQSRRAPIAPNKLSAREALRKIQTETDPFWRNAREVDYRSVREVLAQHEVELDRGLRLTKVLHGDKNKKRIALTFDDGPHPRFTARLLQILARYRVPATFFVVGQQAERYPELVRMEVDQGHLVGNHTYHHVSLPKIPPEFAADEIKACGEVIQAITGKTPTWFRPPGGEYNRRVAEISEALGYTMALWTDDPGDYASPGADTIYARTMRKATPGGIVLLHDGVEQTVKILPALLESLKRQGFTIVPLDTFRPAGR